MRNYQSNASMLMTWFIFSICHNLWANLQSDFLNRELIILPTRMKWVQNTYFPCYVIAVFWKLFHDSTWWRSLRLCWAGFSFTFPIYMISLHFIRMILGYMALCHFWWRQKLIIFGSSWNIKMHTSTIWKIKISSIFKS